MTRSKSKYASIGFGERAESRLRGTKLLSRNEVMTLAEVSESTLTRAVRAGRGDRSKWGQATIPGLGVMYINGALAFVRNDVRRWMKARRKNNRRTSCSNKINRDPSKLRPNEH
jgi:predicted DNA-binding transcriptional regulator AlpA